MTSERGDVPMASEGEDQAVLLYLAAVQAQHQPAERPPRPEAAAAALAGASMVAGDDRNGLETHLAAFTPGSDAHARRLEDGFVQAAAEYGRRHAMTYESWRQAGVAPEVLARAGIEPQGD